MSNGTSGDDLFGCIVGIVVLAILSAISILLYYWVFHPEDARQALYSFQYGIPKEQVSVKVMINARTGKVIDCRS